MEGQRQIKKEKEIPKLNEFFVVNAVESEHTSRRHEITFYLRTDKGELLLTKPGLSGEKIGCPKVEITRVEGYIGDPAPFYYKVYCKGIDDGFGGEFGVKVIFNGSKITIKSYPEEYLKDRYPSGSQRYEAAIEKVSKGVFSIYPAKYLRTDNPPNIPVIRISNKGVQVADKFVEFGDIPDYPSVFYQRE